MIQKLRKQFILVAMCSTMAVLLIIIGSLNIVNYWNMVKQKDEILEILSSNNGVFPEMFGQKRMKWDEEPPEPPKEDRGMPGNEMQPGRSKNFFDRDRDRFSRETAYETRFFSVELNENREVEGLDLGMIASVEEETAGSYAVSILKQYQKSGNPKGFLDEYRYLLTKKGNSYLVVFVDCATDLQEIRKGFLSSVAVSAAGIIAVFLLVVFFSKKVFRPVEESYEKQKRFITDASHELKTPLTIISANVEVLEMESEESQWSKSIKKQIDRMVGLVEQMVTLSRLDEQRDIQRESFSLSEAVKDTAELYVPVAESGGKSLELDIEDNISFVGDEKQIRQMVGLLLDNSMKYASLPEKKEGKQTEAGENSECDRPLIRLSLKKKGKKTELRLWNTASGLEAGDQSILFERFYRPDSSRNSSKGGSGIGLSIVKSIVEAHRGRITAGSRDGSSIEFKAIFLNSNEKL